MGHVHHEVRRLSVGDLAQALVVPITRVSGRAADEHLGLEEAGLLLEEIVIDQTGGDVDLVRQRLKVDGRGGDLAFLQANLTSQHP